MLRKKLSWALALGAFFCLFGSSAQADVTMRLIKVCETPWVSTFQVALQKHSEPVSWMPISCGETMMMQVSAGTYTVKEKLDVMPTAVFLDKIDCKDTGSHVHFDPNELVMFDGRTYECEIWNKQRVVPSMGGPAAAVLAVLLSIGLFGYARARRV